MTAPNILHAVIGIKGEDVVPHDALIFQLGTPAIPVHDVMMTLDGIAHSLIIVDAREIQRPEP